jgi:tyrosine-protein phosphatase YwqE
MFFFKKRKVEHTDLSWLGTDLHSHLLPGIDDGSPDMATSIELVKGLMDLGYKKLITTPHILWEIYPNTPEIIVQIKEELKPILIEAGVDIEFNAAAEYFIDEHFDEELRNRKPLLAIKDNLVLVEFSMVTAPFDLLELLFEMQLQGYQPLIAHPERYVYLRNRRNFFDELKDAGCQFQLNLLSLTGHYGAAVQELAEHLVRKEYYDYAGTDLHHARHLQLLQKLAAAPLYGHLKDSGRLKNHLL